MSIVSPEWKESGEGVVADVQAVCGSALQYPPYPLAAVPTVHEALSTNTLPELQPQEGKWCHCVHPAFIRDLYQEDFCLET